MNSAVLKVLFDQIIEGKDIPVAASMLRQGARRVADTPEGLPYSLIENLWHAVYWQDLWLRELQGEKVPSLMAIWEGDWRTPQEVEFADLREQFLQGLFLARGMCKGELDEKQVELLLRIAVHGTYHIGQMNLVKRVK